MKRLTQFHMDIAASIQKVTEEIMINLAKSLT
jgi:carbamoyltransferase